MKHSTISAALFAAAAGFPGADKKKKKKKHKAASQEKKTESGLPMKRGRPFASPDSLVNFSLR